VTGTIAGVNPAVPPAPAARLPFFVYGTLRPGEANHDAFLRGRTSAERPALLTGAVLYDGPGYPYAVAAAGPPATTGTCPPATTGIGLTGTAGPPAATVTGDLFTARPEAYAELLTALDRLEEYVPGDPRSLYERVEREVLLAADGTPVRAWVYLAGPAVTARLRTTGRLITGGDWTARRGTRPGP
jgi:gamma-glutamylcyclotransferase (GGCT)/AIG2-like uncharacterized protein YtfP